MAPASCSLHDRSLGLKVFQRLSASPLEVVGAAPSRSVELRRQLSFWGPLGRTWPALAAELPSSPSPGGAGPRSTAHTRPGCRLPGRPALCGPQGTSGPLCPVLSPQECPSRGTVWSHSSPRPAHGWSRRPARLPGGHGLSPATSGSLAFWSEAGSRSRSRDLTLASPPPPTIWRTCRRRLP